MSEQGTQGEAASLADEAGIVFDDALARQESKPINGRATPQQVGYFEAGFNAGAEWQRGRVSPVTREGLTDEIAYHRITGLGRCVCGFVLSTYGSMQHDPKEIARHHADALMPLLPVAPPAEVSEDDERIIAWERVAVHEAFNSCYGESRPLIESVVNRLSDLVSLEQTVNELAPAPPAEVEWEYQCLAGGTDWRSCFAPGCANTRRKRVKGTEDKWVPVSPEKPIVQCDGDCDSMWCSARGVLSPESEGKK